MHSNNRSGFTIHQTRIRSALVALGIASMSLAPASSVFALGWDNGEGLTFDLDTTVSYAIAMRAEGQDKAALANINNDDGNRNFEQGDLVNNRFKVIVDADLAYNNFGAFLRGKAFYDFAYMGDNANDSPLTNNNSAFYGGSLTDTNEFTQTTEDRHGKDAEILDAYLYGSFDVGETALDLRMGRQAVSWGQSLFLFNSVMTAQSPLDATEANVPGVELRDLLLPVGQVFASISFMDNFSFAGYYQWEWAKTRLNESGAYFATPSLQANDAILEAGERVLLQPGAPIDLNKVGGDNDAKDDGQFGLAFNYFAEALNSTEFGLYYINYHEKIPIVGFHPLGGQPSPINSMLPPAAAFADASGYSLDYAEDVKLFGFSVGTVLADAEFGLEMTYRQDYPIPVVNRFSPFGVAADSDVFQAQLSSRKIFPNVLMADQWVFAGEVGVNTVFDYEGELIAGKDETAWGFVVKIIPAWNRIAQNLDLEVPFTANISPGGVSPVGATFSEGANSYGLALDFIYRAVYKVSLSYTMFTGDADENSNTDRDFVGLSFKYTF